MINYKFPPKFVDRFRAYLDSEEYSDINAHSKSEYWKHHSKTVVINISGNQISVDGRAGCYIPPEKGISGLKNKFIRLVNDPSALVSLIKRKMGAYGCEIRLLSYFEAFDKVMSSDKLSNPELSPYRINFKKIKERPGAVVSMEDMNKIYFARDKYKITANIVHSYYLYNILNGYLDLTKKRRILEIGAGNGNLLSILHNASKNSNIIDVDLPETLAHAILYISDLFPDARILMPHETKPHNIDDFDFVFLTPMQIHMIEDIAVDLAINISSFQEMTHKQIEEYFQLIQRCGKNNSYFLTSNRVEKIPSGPDVYEKEALEPPNRFSEYPWSPNNNILVYEICRLCGLCQLGGIYIRLEQIKKE